MDCCRVADGLLIVERWARGRVADSKFSVAGPADGGEMLGSSINVVGGVECNA